MEKADKKETIEEHVSRAEFEAFAEHVRGILDDIQKQLTKPQDVKPKYIHCSEEGCSYQTDDLGAFVKHAFDERMRKLSETAPKGHQTIEELIACKDCFPKLETALIKKGFVKYREEDICPECGTKLVTPLLEKPQCPRCGWKRR